MIMLFLLLSLVLGVLGWIIVIARKSNKSKSNNTVKLIGIVIVSLVIAAATSVLFFVWAFGEFRDSKPVITDTFYLHKKGTIKEYVVNPRFKDWLAGANGDYELAVYLDTIPSNVSDKINLSPIVKVITLSNNIQIDSVTINKLFPVEIDKRSSKKVLITKLPKVLWTIKNDSYTVKVEVVQGDETLLPYAHNFSTQIAVDSYP
jgi:heme/copper-type cytochrome/quinol oxidase subunit 2